MQPASLVSYLPFSFCLVHSEICWVATELTDAGGHPASSFLGLLIISLPVLLILAFINTIQNQTIVSGPFWSSQ